MVIDPEIARLEAEIRAIRALKEPNLLWYTALWEADLQAERWLRGAEEPIR